MKWSVAIFGHERPDYYYLDKKTGLRTAEFVGEPTREISSDEKLHVVTGNESRAKPGDIVAFMPAGHKWGTEEKKGFLIVEIEGLTRNQMEALCEPYWDTVMSLDKETGLPKEYVYKRRFNILMSDLESWGIDIEKMKDKDLSYVPKLDTIDYKQCFDKLRNRKVLKTDGLNMIKSIYE